MKSAKSIANSNSINDPHRCQHRTSSGRRCRLAVVDPRSGLCFQHAEKQSGHVSNLRPFLAGQTTNFEEAHEVNKFLSNLLLLLAEDRVSPRRGAVMAYTCNLILRTLTVGMQELRVHGEDEPVNVSVDFGDLPRPNRTQPYPDSSEESKPS